MKPRRVTSKQVAERAGVSQTTVSFVLNNVRDANISMETRERVLAAARELKYIPDVSARSLARGRSNNLALVLVQPHRQIFIDEYLPRVITGISDVVQEYGYRIIVERVHSSDSADIYQKLLYSKEAAGMIINFSYATDEHIQNIIACTNDGMPVVSLMNIHPNVYSVEVNKIDGVRIMTQHLIDLGYRRIACIAYDRSEENRHIHERVHVFLSTLRKNGIEPDLSLLRYGAFDPETGYAAMKDILESASRTGLPEVVFGLNDMMAFGAMRAIQESGLRVPDDIAVVGFDDVRLANFSSPPLTTMNEPDEEHGRLAAQMVTTLLEGKVPPERHISLNTRLVIRDSCGTHLRKK